MTEAGITIEYQDDSADLAAKLVPEITKRLAERTPLPGEDDLRTLVKHQDELLQFIAAQLGMKAPSEDMVEVFRQLPHTIRVLQSIRDCRRFRIWHADELKRLLASGHKDPWLTYRPETDDFEIGKNLTDWEHEPNIQAIPIIIKDDPTLSPISQATAQLDMCQDVPKALPAAGVICHEIAEMAMLYDLSIRGAFRRWFCEGAANCIAASCVQEFLGKDAAAAFVAAYDPADYKDMEDQVDLLRWRSVEWEEQMPSQMDDRLRNAHYAYATWEVLALTNIYGPGVLPAIFRDVAGSKNKDHDAILDAIKRVTGEDYRKRLAEYGTKSADRFKGLAITDFRIGTGERTGEHQWRITQETTNIPLYSDDKHGILVTFRCAAADPPAQVRCVCTTPRKPDGRPGDETCTFGSDRNESSIWAAFTFEEERYLPGDARVRVYLNDKLVKDIKLKMVDTGSGRQD